MKYIYVILLVISTNASGQLKTHASCDDPEPWHHLETLIEQFRGTTGEGDVLYLRNLRIFVCEELRQGRLAQAAATALFDNEKARIVREWERKGTGPAF